MKNQTPIDVSSSGRRDFLKKSALAAAALTWPFSALPESLKSVLMGVVVHSYGMRWGSKVESAKYPGFTNALDLMRHCHSIGAGGIQTMVGGWAEDFAKKVRDEREKLGMYLEGSIGLPKDSADLDRFEKEVRLAKEAGATVLRTVCLSGRRYENFKTEAEWITFKENSIKSIQLEHPDLDVVIHGNFGLNTVTNMSIDFPKAGKWYNYFTGEEITLSSTARTVSFRPSEFVVYTSKKLPTPEKGILQEDFVTAIPEEVNTNGFKVYPNPASQTLTVELPKDMTEATFRVVDMAGRLIFDGQRRTADQILGFDLSEIQAGIYIFEAFDNKRVLHQRFIKK